MEEQHSKWNGIMALGVGVGVLALLFLAAGDIIPVSKFFNSAGEGPNADQLAALPAPPEPIITESGLFMFDTKLGEGREAESGTQVTVHYKGALMDGTEFDSSYTTGTPLTFTLGAGEVIKGWDEGLVGMKVGGERTMIVPPELAYGAEQYGPIPPDSVLTFDVVLVDVVGGEMVSTTSSADESEE